eukprot:4391877-Amphidinium_carterae.1
MSDRAIDIVELVWRQCVFRVQEKATQLERDIGAMCFHPCIMQSVKTFQDSPVAPQHPPFFISNYVLG